MRYLKSVWEDTQTSLHIVSNINNLLTGHNFESLTSWSEMPGNCDDLYISNYAYETYAKFGKKVLRNSPTIPLAVTTAYIKYCFVLSVICRRI